MTSSLQPLFATLLGQPDTQPATSLRGMYHLGNTCYGNALLVSLSRLPLLRGWLSTHERTMAADHSHTPSICTACILAEDLKHLTDTSTRTPMTPDTMRYSGLWCPDEVVQGQQQDAEEAFQALCAACDDADVQQLRSKLHLQHDERLPQRVRYAMNSSKPTCKSNQVHMIIAAQIQHAVW